MASMGAQQTMFFSRRISGMNDIVLFLNDMDPEKAVWLTVLTAGSILFLCGFAFCFRKQGRNEQRFAFAALLEFAASWILHFPGELFQNPEMKNPVLRLIESVSTALLKSLTIYGGEGYERVVYEGHPYFSSLYGSIRVLVNIALLLFVGGFILKFLDSPLQEIKFFFRKKKPAYIFSGVSDETLSIAKTVPGADVPGKVNLIFACGDRETAPEEMEEIGETGGIRTGCTAAGALAKVKKHVRNAEIFLFGGEEQDRLARLDEVVAELNRDDTPDQTAVRIYVEIRETPWRFFENTAQNMLPGRKNVIVNFICPEENFAFDFLLKHSIFENALRKEECREIRAAVIGGMNERNLELLKAMLHLSQMPGYRLTLLVLDEGEGRARLRQLMPEICDECGRVGDAVYTLDYREHIDLETDRLETLLENEYPDLTFAFVNAGSDLRNIGLALRVSALRKRKGMTPGGCRITVNTRDPRILKYWDRDLVKDLLPVGATEDTYSYAFITMPDIERASKAIHEVRYHGRKTWEEYCGSEYNRHSVYARTLSFKYKVRLIDEEYGADHEAVSRDRLWKMYEHMRWNVYVRTLGYRRADPSILKNGSLDRETRLAAMVHNDLVDFAELPEEVQKQDGLVLTEPVVEILRSI
jgi:hypothetical protein